MAHWPFKVVAGPGDKPMVEGERRAGWGRRRCWRRRCWRRCLPQLAAGRTARLRAAPGQAPSLAAPSCPAPAPTPLPCTHPPPVTFKGEVKQFSAEEISSMVLVKMKEVAET